MIDPLVSSLPDAAAVRATVSSLFSEARAEVVALGAFGAFGAAVPIDRIRRRIVLDRTTRELVPPAGGPSCEARVVPSLPLAMLVVDTRAALLSMDPARADGAVLVRAPAVVAALRGLFDLVWEHAAPVVRRSDQARPTPTQTRLLELMAAGLKDEAIARQLGTSVRTVRRHVTALEQLAGVDNRVSLAVAAVRRGWLR